MRAATLWLDGAIVVETHRLPLRGSFALLDALAEERSVRGAAERLEVSYRSAWGRISALEEAVGRALVAKTKGHGSVLTPAGRALRDALAASLDTVSGPLAEEEGRLGERLRAVLAPLPERCRIAASHDPLLTELIGSLDDVELDVVGSAEAIERLLAGRADAAGFHLGPSTSRPGADPSARLGTGFRVLPLFGREQGLMLAPGNPRGIRAVADLARPDVTFVNRQKGSGTRAWLDHLLAEAGLAPGEVRGYGREEFTHGAVAATVAAGVADAGLGVRAAADRLGLDFLHLAEETYFLALRPGPVPAAIAALLARLDLDPDLLAAAG